jgi:hypothetical protein
MFVIKVLFVCFQFGLQPLIEISWFIHDACFMFWCVEMGGMSFPNLAVFCIDSLWQSVN